MLQEGQIAILKVDKFQADDQESEVKINAGVCGLIVEKHKESNGNMRYTMDFGPEGQWYCYENELSSNQETPEPDENQGYINFGEEKSEPMSVSSLNPEADMKKRVKQLEKGIIE